MSSLQDGPIAMGRFAVHIGNWNFPFLVKRASGKIRSLTFSSQSYDSCMMAACLPTDSVWRPLKGPNNDWPLALCDWTTIDQGADIRLNDGLRRDRIDENSLLHYSPSHKWYYIKDQTVEDLIVFRQTDSTNKLASKFPHLKPFEHNIC